MAWNVAGLRAPKATHMRDSTDKAVSTVFIEELIARQHSCGWSLVGAVPLGVRSRAKRSRLQRHMQRKLTEFYSRIIELGREYGRLLVVSGSTWRQEQNSHE